MEFKENNRTPSFSSSDEPHSTQVSSKPKISHEERMRQLDGKFIVAPQNIRIKRKHYTLEDFKTEWDEHPEWHGLSTKELKKVAGGGGFYTALLSLAKKEAKGDIKKQNNIVRFFIPSERVFRDHYTLEDFKTEWDEHPEWHGLSTKEIQKSRISHSYYDALIKFAKKESKGNEEKRRAIIERFFPAKLVYRDHYTLEDFKTEWDEHPEWHGLSTTEAAKTAGVSAFYKSLCVFFDKEKCENEIKFFFPEKYVYRSHYTLEDYKSEWAEHPEWHELEPSEKNDGGIGAFYKSLTIFANKESAGNEEKRRAIIEQFFPAKFVYRDHYTLEDFKTEWDEHPEWHGLSTKELKKVAGGGGFYTALLSLAKKEAKGDIKKQNNIVRFFIPSERVFRDHYTLEDFKTEWDEHPEWHGLSTGQIRIERNGGGFLQALNKFINETTNGDKSLRDNLFREFFPLKELSVSFNRGFSLQYSLEIILKIINNSNLFVEKSIKIDEKKGNYKPDLLHFSEDGKKINIFDIKLQTTTQSITKDIVNYTNYIKEKYPKGGNLVFLCLNGPDLPKETVHGIDNVTVRYYHVLDFIERLTDNTRNKFLLRFITGKEDDELSDIVELTSEETAKINEIKNQLLILRDQVQRKDDKDTKVTFEELVRSTFALRKKLGKLAKKATKEELMKIDFKELMNL